MHAPISGAGAPRPLVSLGRPLHPSSRAGAGDFRGGQGPDRPLLDCSQTLGLFGRPSPEGPSIVTGSHKDRGDGLRRKRLLWLTIALGVILTAVLSAGGQDLQTPPPTSSRSAGPASKEAELRKAAEELARLRAGDDEVLYNRVLGRLLSDFAGTGVAPLPSSGGKRVKSTPLPPPGASGSPAPAAGAEWTVMVYMNAKNNLEPFSFRNFNQMNRIGSTDKVNVLVEFGRPQRHYTPASLPEGNWSKTLRFRVEKDKRALEANAIGDLGKVDMGRGKTLTDFVAWCKENYPAKHYMLVIWDHGQGWRFQTALRVQGAENRSRLKSLREKMLQQTPRLDRPGNKATLPEDEVVLGVVRHISLDEDTGNKLYNRDMQDSLRHLLGEDKLDVIGFDACLMSMIETAFAIREIAKVQVASQELEPGTGWDYSLWLKALTDNPSMDEKELARTVIAAYKVAYNNGNDTTMAAVDLAQITRLAASVSSFAKLADAGLDQNLAEVKKARTACLTYAPDYYLPYIDLGLFLDKIAAGQVSPALKQQALAARAAMKDVVLENYAAPTRQGEYGSSGLSIYFPESKAAFDADPDHEGYLPSNTYYPVEFVSKYSWSQFLGSYFSRVQ